MVQKNSLHKYDENVYLKHIEQDDWNTVQAYHIESEAVWRNVAILAIIALVMVSIYAMYSVNQDKHKTLIFEKDHLGNITALGLATKSFNVDNKIIAHQLINFIVSLRSIPLDINLKRKNIDLVHKMIDPKIMEKIDQIIIGQYKKAKGKQIIVAINSIKPLSGGNSWQINWEEKIVENSISFATSSWSSIVTFKMANNVIPEIQLVNPTGLFITYLEPTEDVKESI